MATNGIENDPEQDATPSGGTTPATGDGGDDGGGLLPGRLLRCDCLCRTEAS